MAGRSRPSLRDLDAQRIALLKPSALGDIVHSLPILTALRRRFPHAHIAWIVNRAYEPLLLGHPDLDETIAFDRGAARSGWWAATRSWLRFLRDLRRKRFDLVVDLQGLLRTALMTQATGAARRVGLSSAREGATWFYSDVIAVSQPNEMHAVDRYWLVAEALGVGDEPKNFHVPIAETARAWAREQLRGCPRPWLAVGVGSRWLTKRWPPQHFAALTQRALRRFGGTAVFVGGRDEAALAQATRQQVIGPARDLTGRTSLPQLAAVLEQTDVMLANDTGPLHLAVALGRPVIAPYTCTKVVRTGPYHAAGGAVESRVWCQGSYLKRCSRMECMTELTPDRLWPLLHEVLLRWESRSRSA
jgi:lipopolysaccharide heptosyltransferase I